MSNYFDCFIINNINNILDNDKFDINSMRKKLIMQKIWNGQKDI